MKCAHCGNIKKDSTELPFEKDFPGLKGLQVYFPETWTDEWFSVNDIQKHCRDNQRIRKAIYKVFQDNPNKLIYVTDLLKELRL